MACAWSAPERSQALRPRAQGRVTSHHDGTCRFTAIRPLVPWHPSRRRNVPVATLVHRPAGSPVTLLLLSVFRDRTIGRNVSDRHRDTEIARRREG